MSADVDAVAYRRKGFTIVQDVFTGREMEGLRREVLRLCRGGYGAIRDLAPCPDDMPDNEVMGRYIACHVVHKAMPPTREMLADRRLVDLVCKLIGPNVKCVHSVLFLKGPGEPGNAWHQDEMFIPTRDRSLTTAWIAIDDADSGNGCLRFLPGSHESGILWPMRRHNDPEFDRAEIAFGYPYDEAAATTTEINAGSVVLFDGYTLHSSFPNRSADRFRRSIQFVYMRSRISAALGPGRPRPGRRRLS